LSGDQLILIPQYLIENNFCKVRRLDLSRNKLSHKKKIISKIEKTTEKGKKIEIKYSQYSYAEEFCLKLGEFISIDSTDKKVSGRFMAMRLIGFNISNMNLGDAILRLADPIKNAKVLATVQISDNNSTPEGIAQFCSILDVNADFARKGHKERVKRRLNDQTTSEVIQTYDS